jgi:hypothetical protein
LESASSLSRPRSSGRMASLASAASGEVEPPKRPLEWSQFEGAHVRSYGGGIGV